MSEQRMAEALDDLRQELKRLAAGDQEANQRVSGLVEDIEQRLKADTVPEHRPRLLREMEDIVTELEVQHPRITGIINDMMMTLSNFGV